MGLVYISSVTASASATVSFTTGIDATYNEYQFHFVNMHPATNNTIFQFQVNASGQTGFNEVMTTTFFRAYHGEGGGGGALTYVTGVDQAQGTAYQPIGYYTGNGNDESESGVLTLYAPSSTTYVKHFVSRLQIYNDSDYSQDCHTAGYINTTAAIDEISFNFQSGNIDAGTIHMYGVG